MTTDPRDAGLPHYEQRRLAIERRANATEPDELAPFPRLVRTLLAVRYPHVKWAGLERHIAAKATTLNYFFEGLRVTFTLENDPPLSVARNWCAMHLGASLREVLTMSQDRPATPEEKHTTLDGVTAEVRT